MRHFLRWQQATLEVSAAAAGAGEIPLLQFPLEQHLILISYSLNCQFYLFIINLLRLFHLLAYYSNVQFSCFYLVKLLSFILILQ